MPPYRVLELRGIFVWRAAALFIRCGAHTIFLAWRQVLSVSVRTSLSSKSTPLASGPVAGQPRVTPRTRRRFSTAASVSRGAVTANFETVARVASRPASTA
jgi:hypothetical protein